MISKNNFFNEYLKLYSNCLNKLDMNLLSSITNLIKKKIKDKKKYLSVEMAALHRYQTTFCVILIKE